MGFRVLSQRGLEELEGTLWELEHEQTGARLIWLDRAEENKTFCVAFQTQPWDDTGVFHILEHSVLCGSERYPLKKPFVELMKTSLNTFLNAITFPDRTVYPISSRNQQDFLNLMRVYMDAVLHPLLLRNPEIFGQEGWHYELGADGDVSCQGVVFNEMKGVFSSPDAQLEYEINRRLFPDTCYRWVAGGDPEHIPELTYEQFKAAHARYYHPSNACFFLDGALELDTVLEILDKEYLSGYTRVTPPPPIPLQPPVDGGRVTIDYELSPREELAGHYRLGLGFVAGTFRDREQRTALQALCDVLCGDNEAPLKRRLLAQGLAQDVDITLCDGVLQPSLQLQVKNLDGCRLQEAQEAVREELARLAAGGLDHRRVRSTLDNLEFTLRERDPGWMPQGLALGFSVLESWLYHGDPAANLCVGTLFEKLREGCEKGYFEDLIQKILLDNPHRCCVILRPSQSLGAERARRQAARVRAVTDRWDDARWQAARQRQAETERWQNTPDSPEALAAMPVLRVDQIGGEPEPFATRRGRLHHIPVLLHPMPTHGITYLNLYFSLDQLDPASLSAVTFLCELLGALDTRTSTANQLPGKIRAHFGSLSFGVEVYGAAEDPGRCRVFLCACASMLDGKAEQATALLAELLRDTQLDHTEKIFEILRQRRSALAQRIAENGHGFAMTRAGAGFSADCAAWEYAGGIAYLNWLQEQEAKGCDAIPALVAALKTELERLITLEGLTVSVTGEGEASAEAITGVLAATLPAGGGGAGTTTGIIRPWGRRREGILLPTDVSFAAISGRFPHANRGTARVMKRIVSLDYLWNQVRVRGGAYGTGMLLPSTGLVNCYSYRDPNAGHSLDCYRRIPAFLERFDGDVQGAIVGAVAESDPLMMPRAKGKTADSFYWRGISQEMRCRIRQEILSTDREQIAAYGAELRQSLGQAGVCVLGPRDQLEACKAEFDEIFAL